MFLDSFSYAQQGTGKRVMLGKMDFLLRDRKFWNSCAFIREYTEKHIDRAISTVENERSHVGRRNYILAHELVKTTNDRAVVCEQLLNMVFAGRDTPAVALTSTFFCLARSPETWRKIRDEVKDLKDEELTFDNLQGLRYVQNVIKECTSFLLREPESCLCSWLTERSFTPVSTGSEYLQVLPRADRASNWRRFGRLKPDLP